MRDFEKSVFKNGVRVLSERHSASRAVAMGIFVDVGTRDEKKSEIGISHLLEHMVFKGTEKRSAYQIAKSLESLGGDLNAYTTREYTCYHSLVLKEDWRVALDVLCDLVSNMKIKAKDFALEKSVILQEIATSEENPEDWIYDEFFKCVYGDHGLGRSILGEIKTIAMMKSRKVIEHYKNFYTGPRIILAAAGNLHHQEFVAAAKKKLGHKSKVLGSVVRTAPKWLQRRHCLNKDTEQIHLILGWPTVSFLDHDRFQAIIANSILGGGMTSRLFQSVREKRGLVYSIYSTLQTFGDGGFVTIYAATEKSKVKPLIEVIRKELNKLRTVEVPKKELDLYKTQIRGGLLLGTDDIENRLASVGINEMVFGDYRSPESIIEEVERVEIKKFRKFLKERMPLEEISGIIMGPGAEELSEWWDQFQFE
jgi:predicted Zn-dependent peptidase